MKQLNLQLSQTNN